MQAREAGMRLGIGAYAVIIRLTSLRSALERVLVSTSKRHTPGCLLLNIYPYNLPTSPV